jgi:hypothetical protein
MLMGDIIYAVTLTEALCIVQCQIVGDSRAKERPLEEEILAPTLDIFPILFAGLIAIGSRKYID